MRPRRYLDDRGAPYVVEARHVHCRRWWWLHRRRAAPPLRVPVRPWP